MKNISEMRIENFRNLHDIVLPIGKKITAIAGQNGTSKTSLLGMISHVFTYPSTYKTITGKPFYSVYSEVFRFSFPKYDKTGEHDYSIHFDDGNYLDVLSVERKLPTGNILRLKLGRKTEKGKISEGGKRKIKKPVVYLGMRRLFPFAQETNVKNNPKDLLTEEEVEYYKSLHNEILLMIDEKITTSRISTRNKEYYAPATEKYDYLGISAGQDNIGQIISAILSFKRLRALLGDKYEGGLIFIDELDASLYPAAQTKLVEKLYKIATDLDLQIFFTTHSMEILEEVNKKTQTGDGIVIYLNKSSGKITPIINPDLDELRRSLKVLGPDQQSSKNKINVYVEDVVAKDFAEHITDKKIKSNIKFIPTELGEGILQELANANMPDLKSSLFLVDGDVSCRTKKILQLPGGVYPELVVYNHLRDLPEDNSVWSILDSGYSKQFCFRDCPDCNEKGKVKAWYKKQKKYFGKKLNDSWKSWKDNNQEEVVKFNEELTKKLEICQ